MHKMYMCIFTYVLFNNRYINFRFLVDLYDQTVKPVKAELGKNPTEREWRKFIEKWSVLSVEEFLRSNIHNIEDGYGLRPWPEAAILAYKVQL